MLVSLINLAPCVNVNSISHEIDVTYTNTEILYCSCFDLQPSHDTLLETFDLWRDRYTATTPLWLELSASEHWSEWRSGPERKVDIYGLAPGM